MLFCFSSRRRHTILTCDWSSDVCSSDLACTGCHADRTPAWAADAVARWYGPGRRQEPHYGTVLAAGRAGRPGAEAGLVARSEERRVGKACRCPLTSM